MIGFFKAAFKRPSGSGTGSGMGSSGAKPSMKVTPKGKTTRSKVFKRDEEGNEYGKHTVVQDEDDNWYLERRKKGTGEAEYRKLNIPGAATDLKYDPVSGKRMAGTEYDSKEQRLASYINRAGGTLRKEGGYSKSSVEGLPHGLRMNVYAGAKNTKEFGDKIYLSPVEHRNKRTAERETREASYKKSASEVGKYMGEKPKPTGVEAWDYYTARDSKAKDIYGEYTVRPKAPSGAKSSFEDIDALAEAHKVKPKTKPFTGADTAGAWAKYAESHKPAGTESTGSTGSSRKYSDADTDAFFSRLHPERTFRVDPAGVATETDTLSPTKDDIDSFYDKWFSPAKPKKKGGRRKKASS